MLKNDIWIIRQAQNHGMLTPFERKLISERDGEKIISFGLSSYGYDIRCSEAFKIVKRPDLFDVISPKKSNEELFIDYTGPVCRIPPHSFALGCSVEYFKVPKDVIGICVGKSTYARCGLIVNVTPLEPEWEGYLTLEFSNTTPYTLEVFANEGIAQIVFLGADKVCRTSYKDRCGKYQGQTGVTLPRLS